MTVQDCIVRNQIVQIKLAEYLQNVSEACIIHGVSR